MWFKKRVDPNVRVLQDLIAAFEKQQKANNDFINACNDCFNNVRTDIINLNDRMNRLEQAGEVMHLPVNTTRYN